MPARNDWDFVPSGAQCALLHRVHSGFLGGTAMAIWAAVAGTTALALHGAPALWADRIGGFDDVVGQVVDAQALEAQRAIKGSGGDDAVAWAQAANDVAETLRGFKRDEVDWMAKCVVAGNGGVPAAQIFGVARHREGDFDGAPVRGIA